MTLSKQAKFWKSPEKDAVLDLDTNLILFSRKHYREVSVGHYLVICGNESGYLNYIQCC